MKTVKEKGQRYDEIIEKLQEFCRDYDTVSGLIDVTEELANIIPEIKISKDERIKKDIKFILANSDLSSVKTSFSEMLNWLEKQGKRKTLTQKEIDDEKVRKYLLKLADRCPEDSIDFMNEVKKEDIVAWLEKQHEKTVWTDHDRTMAFTLLRDVDQMTYISNEGKNERLEWLNSLEDRFA